MVIRTHEILTFVIGWTCFKQEAIVYPPWVAMAVRPKPGVWEYVRVNVDELMLDELSVSEYLAFKELLVNEQYVKIYLLKQIISFRKRIYIEFDND